MPSFRSIQTLRWQKNQDMVDEQSPVPALVNCHLITNWLARFCQSIVLMAKNLSFFLRSPIILEGKLSDFVRVF